MNKLEPDKRFRFLVLLILCFIILTIFGYRFEEVRRAENHLTKILGNEKKLTLIMQKLNIEEPTNANTK